MVRCVAESGGDKVKMARATEEDVKVLREFLEWLENYSEYGTDSRKEYDGDADSYPVIDDEAALEFIREQFSRFRRTRNVGMVWNRVVYGYSVLHDNCCDPEKDYLDWKPELRAVIDAGSPMEITVDVHPFAVDAFETV